MYTLANGSSAALQMGGGSSPPCPALTSQAPAGSAAPCCGRCGALEGTLAPGPPAPTPPASLSACWSSPHTSPQCVRGSVPSRPPWLCVIAPHYTKDAANESTIQAPLLLSSPFKTSSPQGVFPINFYFYFFRESGRGREEERERDIPTRETHRLAASCLCPPLEPGVEPATAVPALAWELYPGPFGARDNALTPEQHWPGPLFSQHTRPQPVLPAEPPGESESASLPVQGGVSIGLHAHPHAPHDHSTARAKLPPHLDQGHLCTPSPLSPPAAHGRLPMAGITQGAPTVHM